MVLGSFGECGHAFLLMFEMALDLPGCTHTGPNTPNHYPRNAKASTTPPKNHGSAHCLHASWNESSRSQTESIQSFFILYFFVFLECVVKPPRSTSGSFSSGTQVGDEPTSKLATPTVAFWRYACKNFGDTRRFSRDAWAPKALWPYACSCFVNLWQTGSQPSSQPASRPASQPSNQPASQPASQPACQPACLPASQPASQPACLPACLPAS